MKLRALLSINSLLAFIPVTLALEFYEPWQNPVLLFVSAGLSIVPLAGLMGQATEELAHKLGQGIGGLLNATFGNAAELIIALFALSKGLVDVVKASITGSIIGNILLVFGMGALGGGLRFKQQTFNRSGARASATTLTLASIALLVPTIFQVASEGHHHPMRIPALQAELSLAIACVLFATYACLLVFTLITHPDLYQGKRSDEEQPAWSITRSVLVLLIATGLIAWMSEILVSSIEPARQAAGLNETFVGVIVVAIIGNAAEHSSAVMAAVKNKMELALGIAIGSSLQIALFVAPVLVFISYAFGTPMNLLFSLPEIVAVGASIYILFQISGDGETNWLEGIQLLGLYAVLAILFYYLPAK